MPQLTKENEKNVLPLMYAMNIMTKEDFVRAFESVLEFVKRTEARLNDAIEKLEQTYKIITDKIESNNERNFEKLENSLTKAIEKQMNEMYQDHEKMMSKIDQRLGELKDGHTPTQEELTALIQPLIPVKKEELPNFTTLIQTTLENLEDFKKLKEENEKIRNAISQVARIRSNKLGMKKITSVRSVDLTSQVDGSATTFTLPQDTLKVLGVWSTQFPITLRETTDFTFAGRTLTLVGITVQSGQTLNALIETAFYA